MEHVFFTGHKSEIEFGPSDSFIKRHKFTIGGFPFEVKEWGYLEGEDRRKHAVGFGETLNHCLYVNVPESYYDKWKLNGARDEYGWDPGWNGSPLARVGEITFEEYDKESKTYRLGWDYQHTHNSLKNTDVFEVLKDAMRMAHILIANE
jgi:hypothetical protein